MAGTKREFTETLTFETPGRAVGELNFRPPPRWRLLRRIGRGGQANVWLAEDLKVGQKVVLKVFNEGQDPVAVERVRREVRLARELHHPRVVRIFDLEEMDGQLVAVMEWVPGGTLKEAAAREGRFPVERVVEIAQQVLETLAYLHEKGIIHRDVKPSNLFLDAEEGVRLGDLGLARHLTRSDDITRTMTTVGTPTYMAPEQLRGEELSPAADLYSLGVTLYRLLAGEPPFTASSEFEVAGAVLHSRPRPIRSHRPDCPRWLASFVDRLLEREPSDRYPDAVIAMKAFRRRRRVVSRRRRRFIAAAVAAAAVVVGGGFAAVRLTESGKALDHVEMSDGVLWAFDKSGGELYRHRAGPGGTTLRYVVGDWLGSREPEVAVERWGGENRSVVVVDILGRGGRKLASLSFEDNMRGWSARVSNNWDLKGMKNADLDGDGRPELVWLISHRTWYPSLVGIWAPRLPAIGKAPLLDNSGWINQVVTADLDGDGADELVLAGQNNPLGYQAVVAVIDLPGLDRVSDFVCLVSPDGVADGSAMSAYQLTGTFSYVPLGSSRTALRIQEAGPGGIVAQVGPETIVLDRWGTPEDSPLWGRGAEVREQFWCDVAILCRRIRMATAGRLDAMWRTFAAHHAEVFSEAPSETAAALLVARAAADGGHHLEASEFLERIAERIPEERDLFLRAGEYRLIAGDRRGGRADLVRSLPVDTRGRSAYDSCLLLSLDAALHGDEPGFDEALRANQSVASGGHTEVAAFLRPVLLWAHGRWNDPRLVQTPTVPAVPFLSIVERWAALMRGVSPDEIIVGVLPLERGSHVRWLARLLHAAAALEGGDSDTALGLAEEVLDAMKEEGARSFELAAWKPVACLVAAEAALEGSGSPQLREWLEAAEGAGPETWYGRRAAELLESVHHE